MKRKTKMIMASAVAALTLAALGYGGGRDSGVRVSFPVACELAVQPLFERAVALSYGHQSEAAVRTFNQVPARDPGCAMAYWGIAVAYMGDPLGPEPDPEALEAGLEAVDKAIALRARNARERDYVEAAAAFFRDHERLPHARRLARYEQAMELLAERHPDDPQAAILHAAALRARLGG